MEPDPAARQLEKVHSHTAVSVLRRLEPKQASEILAEMGTERASILIQIIANENTELMKEKKS
jgi:flagellar motility protein MotE (MotC chaperone)